MTQSSDSYPRHIVDHEYKKVYIFVSNWKEASEAPDWVNKNNPGYDTIFVTEQTLDDKDHA